MSGLRQIDPDGDLILAVGDALKQVSDKLDGDVGHYAQFRVCSSALRRQSPVWKAMLFGPWHEAKPEQGQWTVELPDDKPSVLQIVLNIVHGRFEDIPEEISIFDLDDLVIFLDKYDMIHTIRPWAKSWKTVISSAQTKAEARAAKIHLAWEFGLESIFLDEIKNAVMDLSLIKSDGGSFEPVLEGPDHHNFPLQRRSNFGPIDLHDKLLEYRLSVIQYVADFFHTQVDCRMGATRRCKIQNHRQNYSRYDYYESGTEVPELCDNLVLGSIWRHSSVRDPESSRPFPRKAPDILESPQSLVLLLSAMFTNMKMLRGHEDCSPAVLFWNFNAKMGIPESFAKHWAEAQVRMQDQRAKLGLGL